MEYQTQLPQPAQVLEAFECMKAEISGYKATLREVVQQKPESMPDKLVSGYRHIANVLNNEHLRSYVQANSLQTQYNAVNSELGLLREAMNCLTDYVIVPDYWVTGKVVSNLKGVMRDFPVNFDNPSWNNPDARRIPVLSPEAQAILDDAMLTMQGRHTEQLAAKGRRLDEILNL
ncbi:MAG: hypothetical protein Q8O89_03530 [Nanoarchaeota archaeon]|nr:hypothetical protein [Nanoarchaeota archaeon]